MAETAVSQRAAPRRQTPTATGLESQRSSGRRSTPADPGRLGTISRVQRGIGNRALHRLLQRNVIQPKLTVGPAHDEYEREADRVADAVMRMPDPAVNRLQPSPIVVQRMCAECEDEQLQRMCAECEEEELHRAPEGSTETAGASSQVSPSLARYLTASRRGGAPLSQTARGFFEPRFGREFSHVRVHTDQRAADASKEISARAFTLGSDIYFASGQYSPGSRAGDRLLGHELTHVVQQSHHRSTPQLQRQFTGCASLIPANPLARVGSLVHNIIEANFLATVRDARRVVIPGASAAPQRTQGLCGRDDSMIDPQQIGSVPTRGGRPAGVGLPDLARLTAGGILQVAELKPAAIECLVDGEEQALRYVTQGNAQDPDQRAWRDSLGVRVVVPMPPSAYQPPPLPLGACRIQTAWCTAGLMAYSVVCPGAPPVPVPRTQEQEQEQRQRARARDDDPLFRLPRGPLWDKVYAAIAILGALAILGTLWGKIGGLLGSLLRALGFTLGLAGGAAADPVSGGTTSVPSDTKGTPVGPDRSRTPKERVPAGQKVTVPKPKTGRQAIKLIEGLNVERVEVGMVFPVMLHEEGKPSGEGRFGTVILQVTKKTPGKDTTTVELKALQEVWTDQKAGKAVRTLGGGTYVLTHPYHEPDSPVPGLIGSVKRIGPDPKWFWTYLENVADQLERAGRKADADQVRREVQRLKQAL